MGREPFTFAFDFVDPGSYLVRVLMGRWGVEGGRSAPRMLPLELAPPLRAPSLSAAAPEWRRMEEALVEAAGAEGIPYAPPPDLPRTRKAHELALHAEEKGRPIYDALFSARFERGLDLGRIDVLIQVAEAEGLDGPEARTVLGVDRFAPQVEEAREEALALGLRGVPTLLHAGRRLEGFRSADEVRRFLEEGGLVQAPPER